MKPLSRYDLGDTDIPFCLQSVVKPLNYALTLNDLSPDVVHKYVGQEPSGRSFNELTLDYQRKFEFHIIYADVFGMQLRCYLYMCGDRQNTETIAFAGSTCIYYYISLWSCEIL